MVTREQSPKQPLPECHLGKFQVFVKKSCKCCFLLHKIFAFVIINDALNLYHGARVTTQIM